jgi:hypothetical protein
LGKYPILTFPELPEIVIELIDRPTEKPWAAGEPTAAVVPSAISNAIFDGDRREDSLSAVQSGKTTADLRIDNVTVRQRVSVTQKRCDRDSDVIGEVSLAQLAVIQAPIVNSTAGTCRKSNSHIQMMKSAEKWLRQNATNGRHVLFAATARPY